MNLISNAVINNKQWEDTPSCTIEEAFSRARSVWPRIRLSYEQFHTFVTRVGCAEMTVPAYPADVYLCIACANGQSIAFRSLEAAYFPSVRAAIFDIIGEKAMIDDILQEVRTRLFVGGSPKIVQYRGSGSLGGWLRKVAVRASFDFRRERNAQRTRNQKLANMARVALPHAGAYDAAGYERRTGVCERAWIHALLGLHPMERQLLHHYFVSGLSIDTLGPMYSVHRATVARRLRRAMERVRQSVRRALSVHLPELSARDLDALVLHSCGDVDLTSTLKRDVS